MRPQEFLTRLLQPQTTPDKWLRAVITAAGAALALILAIVLFATAGDSDDNEDSDTGDTNNAPVSAWETVTGTVTDIRVHTTEDADGNPAESVWFVTYEYTAGEYYIKTEQLTADLFAKGDTATIYYAADDHGHSTLIAPGTGGDDLNRDDDHDGDSGSGSTAGVILLVIAGLLTALTIVQILDLRRDAMGPNA